MSLERVSGPVFRNVLAAEPGATWNVMVSTNLSAWDFYATYQVPSNGLIEFRVTNGPALPPTFFKAHRH